MTTSKLVLSKQPCPSCSSSDAYHLWDDGHGYCFSCKTYTPPGDRSFSATYSYEYLPWRGIPKEMFEFYGVKTKITPNGQPLAVGYPYPNGAIKVRYLDRKEFYWEKASGDAKPGLFGMDKFSPGASKYVTITEGELDAISLCYALREGTSSIASAPVVSVRSAASAGSDCNAARSWLQGYERVYVCMDNDAAGREATAAIARIVDPNKVYHVKLSVHKDPNEFITNGKSDELRKIWWRAKKYLPETVISSFADFQEELIKPVPPSAPFPWPSWNEWLYGIRRGESYLITALEGVGKTEIMHAIEHHLLKERPDENVGAIFLEEPKKRHLQAIAGLELKVPAHLPDRGVTPDTVLETLQKVVGGDDRLFLYTHYGADDPDVLLDTIRFLVTSCDCPYILLDHISMACSGLQGESERTALDYIVTRLEMMVVELNFALIFVSHVNDLGLTRGSRMISKVANTRIDLKRNIMADNDNDKNTVIVEISKNRFGSKTGVCCQLRFDPHTFTFRELEGEEDGGQSTGLPSEKVQGNGVDQPNDAQSQSLHAE